LSEMLNNTIERLDQKPQQIKIHVPGYLATYNKEIDGSSFYYYILSSSYLDNNYAALPYIIQQVEKNRFDAMTSFYEAYILDFLTTSGTFYSVICADHSTLITTDTDESVLIPTMMGWEIENQSENREECLSWNVPRSPFVLDVMPETNVPTLLLSGYFDPVTPPEYGEITFESFPQGQHIIDPFGSHGVAFTDLCTYYLVDSFLTYPSYPLQIECLSDLERLSPPVEKSALSIPFIRRSEDIAKSYIFISVLILLLMILRIFWLGVRKIYKRYKGALKKRTPAEWKLHRRFELADWVFTLSCLGFGLGLSEFRDQLSELPGYWNASALPAEASWVMIIPVLMVIILPAVVIPSFRLWKYNRSILRRTYYLFQALVCSLFSAHIIYTNMLFIWVR
ncbi:MAG: alpha/beta hydrolase, partial [Candidatus Hodarchaeales archaeon]